MTRHVVVYHGYNEQLFSGRAHFKALRGDNWTALEPGGGRPSSKADLTSFIRSAETPAVFAAYAVPAFGDSGDLQIRSIVPIGHPIVRAFVNYRRRAERQLERASFADFVRTELARTRNSIYLANGQLALLAGGEWHRNFNDSNEIQPIVREVCEHAELGLVHFPQLMQCALVKTLMSAGAPISAPLVLHPTADNELVTDPPPLKWSTLSYGFAH